jgi:hypothetical protein
MHIIIGGMNGLGFGYYDKAQKRIIRRIDYINYRILISEKSMKQRLENVKQLKKEILQIRKQIINELKISKKLNGGKKHDKHTGHKHRKR